MATASLLLTPRFQQRLEEFKQNLSPDQEENFKFTTLDDLKRLVHSIQEEQTKSRRLTNLRRLAPFLEAMEQFDKVVQIFLNAADLLACIWATQTYHDAFNALLDAYVDIGESIPLLAQYEQVFQDKAQMHVVLELVYTDVLDFHASAIKYFKSPVWKQLFHATWKTFRSKFEPTLSNLRRHKSLLETESNLLFLQQYQVDRQKIQVQFENIELQAEHNRKITINNWLSPAESESDYRAASSARLENPNSCRWILQEEKMKRWLDPKYPLKPLLWVNGKPGAGKTVLASLIIDECRRSSHRQTMFFFHKHGEEKKNSLIATLRGLLSQAVRVQPQLIPYLFEEAAKSGSSLLEDVELAKALTEISLAAFDSIFLVLDGLDECPMSSKKPITTFFRSLVDKCHQQRPGAFRCCFFSQQDNDIGDLLKTVPSFTITGKQNSTDIRSFCRIKAETIREELEYPEEMADRMADKVSSRADGMFVFAVLIMKYLEEQTSWKNLEKEVEDMPLDLNGVYERIVKRVLYDAALAERAAARMLLGWLLTAVRPLKWHEVQGAIAYDQPSHTFDLQGSKLRKGPKRLCGSLVELFDDGEIRLVHLSAKLCVFKSSTITTQTLTRSGILKEMSLMALRRS
ncbi:Vegetative incompatibility protein HET-E-1 [Diplodia seriata]|uniref:Vegetative incompatibility protein HET-E-1 n=1 Tax=Diplodia seriata TaxID=420778 RepID=A0A1S8BA06_9PEZI|nr:Vegetative incompatibility protein HET-E-1 [Diplodia seriata]